MDLSYGAAYSMNATEARRRLVETYAAERSITATARLWHTSRAVVRKWMRRYRERGLAGLDDMTRKPRSSPARTAPEIEQAVKDVRPDTGYGRKRLAWLLRTARLSSRPRCRGHLRRARLLPHPQGPHAPAPAASSARLLTR